MDGAGMGTVVILESCGKAGEQGCCWALGSSSSSRLCRVFLPGMLCGDTELLSCALRGAELGWGWMRDGRRVGPGLVFTVGYRRVERAQPRHCWGHSWGWAGGAVLLCHASLRWRRELESWQCSQLMLCLSIPIPPRCGSVSPCSAAGCSVLPIPPPAHPTSIGPLSLSDAWCHQE